MNGTSGRTRRHWYFFLFVLGSFVIFWTTLRDLISFALLHDYGSHILLIAPVSAGLIYLNRRTIFSRPQTNLTVGAILLLAGTTLRWAAYVYSFRGLSLSLGVAATIMFWISGFVLCYGIEVFRAARFSLLFLLLMIPVPEFVIDKVIFFLQAGSATVAYWVFRCLTVPVYKEGFVFLLPTLNIEVAKECSGIRSSIVLLITTLLAGEFLLRSLWRKSLLVLSAVPILLIKNGIRIVTISLLTIYVDPGFMYGWLHTSGGMVFYALGVLSLFPVIVVLKRGEINRINPAGDRLCQAKVDPSRTCEVAIAKFADAEK